MKKLIFLVLLLLVISVNCAPVGLSFPSVSYLSAEPSSILPGESATLRWYVSGATRVSIDQGIGNVALFGEWTVTPNITTIYKLTAKNAIGVSVLFTAQKKWQFNTPCIAGLIGRASNATMLLS